MIKNELSLYLSENDLKRLDLEKISQKVFQSCDSILYGMILNYIFDSQLQMRNLLTDLRLYTHIIFQSIEIDKEEFKAQNGMIVKNFSYFANFHTVI